MTPGAPVQGVRTSLLSVDPRHQCGNRRQQGEEVGQGRAAAVVPDEDRGVRLPRDCGLGGLDAPRLCGKGGMGSRNHKLGIHP